jgi:hypothetical protein
MGCFAFVIGRFISLYLTVDFKRIDGRDPIL